MGLFSADLAVVSVGMSCQGAHQLRANADLVGELARTSLEVHTTPFDWIICGPAGVAAMVRAGEFFPADVRELALRRSKPYWERRRCYFWHMKGAIADHAAAAAHVARQADQLERITAARRRVFVLANTQNNLATQRRLFGGFDVPFTAGDVAALHQALEDRWGGAELYVVTRAGLHALGGRAGVWELPADRTSWDGPTDRWRAVLAAIFANENPPAIGQGARAVLRGRRESTQ